MTEKSKNYFGVILLVTPFVITFFIGRELLTGVFGQTLGVVTSSLVGALVGFFFYHVLRNQGFALRGALLMLYILLLALGWKMATKHIDQKVAADSGVVNEVMPTVQGNWLAEEAGVSLNVKIGKDSIELIYYPDTTKQLYTYEIVGNTLELNGVNLEDQLLWEFTFLDSWDSIEIESEGFVFVLSRQ